MKTLTGGIILLCIVLTAPSLASDANRQDQRRQYQERLDKELRQLDRKLDELKEKAIALGKESKERIDQEIEQLRKKQEAANKKLDELKSASSKAWEKVRKEADSAMEELEKLYHQVEQRFK